MASSRISTILNCAVLSLADFSFNRGEPHAIYDMGLRQERQSPTKPSASQGVIEIPIDQGGAGTFSGPIVQPKGCLLDPRDNPSSIGAELSKSMKKIPSSVSDTLYPWALQRGLLFASESRLDKRYQQFAARQAQDWMAGLGVMRDHALRNNGVALGGVFYDQGRQVSADNKMVIFDTPNLIFLPINQPVSSVVSDWTLLERFGSNENPLNKEEAASILKRLESIKFGYNDWLSHGKDDLLFLYLGRNPFDSKDPSGLSMNMAEYIEWCRRGLRAVVCGGGVDFEQELNSLLPQFKSLEEVEIFRAHPAERKLVAEKVLSILAQNERAMESAASMSKDGLAAADISLAINCLRQHASGSFDLTTIGTPLSVDSLNEYFSKLREAIADHFLDTMGPSEIVRPLTPRFDFRGMVVVRLVEQQSGPAGPGDLYHLDNLKKLEEGTSHPVLYIELNEKKANRRQCAIRILISGSLVGLYQGAWPLNH